MPKRLAGYKAIVLMFLQAAVFIYFISLALFASTEGSVTEIFRWIPGLGLNLSFIADGLSGAFALLITGIGFLVFLFAHLYMKNYENTGGFYLHLNLFSASMLGLVLSGNLIQMFIFWELTTVFSFFLIGFFHEKDESRKAAFQSLFVTGFGGLCLLTGIILLGTVTGSYSISDWILHADEIRNNGFNSGLQHTNQPGAIS
ncbi:MAG: proton-conducting transporter membrane subunit [Bacteroidales bacterium]